MRLDYSNLLDEARLLMSDFPNGKNTNTLEVGSVTYFHASSSASSLSALGAGDLLYPLPPRPLPLPLPNSLHYRGHHYHVNPLPASTHHDLVPTRCLTPTLPFSDSAAAGPAPPPMNCTVIGCPTGIKTQHDYQQHMMDTYTYVWSHVYNIIYMYIQCGSFRI